MPTNNQIVYVFLGFSTKSYPLMSLDTVTSASFDLGNKQCKRRAHKTPQRWLGLPTKHRYKPEESTTIVC